MASMTFEPGIAVEDVTVVRGGHTALTDVTFDVGPGTLMGVLGPNGAGKSTLFDAIAGVLPVTKGTVTLRGAATPRSALAYVPQRAAINWVFPATVQDVVTMGCCNVGLFRRPGKKEREMVPGLSRTGRIVGAALVPDDPVVRRTASKGFYSPGIGPRGQRNSAGRGVQRR